MKTSFIDLMVEQHRAKVALEKAMERLLETEELLIQKNPRLPEFMRLRGKDAALELVKLVAEQKLKELTESVEEAALMPAVA